MFLFAEKCWRELRVYLMSSQATVWHTVVYWSILSTEYSIFKRNRHFPLTEKLHELKHIPVKWMQDCGLLFCFGLFFLNVVSNKASATLTLWLLVYLIWWCSIRQKDNTIAGWKLTMETCWYGYMESWNFYKCRSTVSTIQFKQVNLFQLYIHNKLLVYAVISDTHSSNTKVFLFCFLYTIKHLVIIKKTYGWSWVRTTCQNTVLLVLSAQKREFVSLNSSNIYRQKYQFSCTTSAFLE